MTVPVLIAALAFAPVPFAAPVSALTPGTSATLEDAAYGSDHRLRPQAARIATWLREARRRSVTVRRLLDRIERGDVVAYLDISRRLAPNVSACLTWMAAAPTRRLVRLTFRHDLGINEAIALLAHELQHVVEVMDHPEVRSEDTLRDLYTRIGHATGSNGLHWDTADAIAVGTLARLEATTPGRPGDGIRKGT